jgi:hypothetical protein
VIYRWPWYWHLPRLGPWLLLSLAILLPATNRDRRALLIFLPPLVLILLWHPTTTLIGMHSINIEAFGVIFESLVFAMALLWLNTDKLAGCRAGMRFVVSLGILLLAGLAVGVSYDSPFSRGTAPLLLLAILVGTVLLIILTGARRLTGGRYDPARFLFWMGLCSVSLSLAGMGSLAAVLAVSGQTGPTGREVLWVSIASGLGLYAINLPYLLLMFSSAFFRPRFAAWLGAGSAFGPVVAAVS